MSNKASLSIHLRRMKFMQRGQSEETNKKLELNTKSVITDQWEIDLPESSAKESVFLSVQNIKEFYELDYGRQSYNGFNKHTEKMMKYWNNEVEEPIKKEDEDSGSVGSISDEEMAERFTTLVGRTIAKKFKRKRARVE